MQIIDGFYQFLSRIRLYTNVLGLARSLIALSTLITLIFTPPNLLFRLAAGVDASPVCTGVAAISIHCLLPDINISRLISIIILLLAVLGWQPRLVAIPHWWATFSMYASGVTIDGGDQVANNLALLLIPICIFDRRRWHWENDLNNINPIALSAYLGIILQVSGIYLHAALGKILVPEWIDGTAIYYWVTQDPIFATVGPFGRALSVLLSSRLAIPITWGSILLELMLWSALFAKPGIRRVIFYLGIIFHTLIAFMFGIISFAVVMYAALILYLWPLDKPFKLPTRFSIKRPKAADYLGGNEHATLQKH